MLLHDAPLTLREFVTHEALPLAAVFGEVFLFLSGRSDAVVFGAHAVNAYARVERMTEEVDVLTTRGAELAEELRAHLGARFHVAVRVREVVPGVGYRVYQLRDAKNRHLVDVRQIDELPAFLEIEGVRVVELIELVAMKVRSLQARLGREKGLSDRLDIHRLLNAFPDLRAENGEVQKRLANANTEVLELWRSLVHERIEPDDDAGY